MTPYVVYDVFTDTRFGGNQLAVIPDATALAEDDLQRIAQEFNFSETTFVYPPENPAHTARVRIFTPTREVPFAGHPTIGTAIALNDNGYGAEMVLELGIGPIACEIRDGMASFVNSHPLEVTASPSVELVARCLTLSPDQIASQPVQAGVGLPFTLAELTDRNALRTITTNLDALKEGNTLHPAGMDFSIYAYVRDGNRIDARMFAPLDNIPEDPATGSAAAALAAYLAPAELTIHQGDDMGRPSLIRATSDGQSVKISGTAVRTMAGQLV